MTKISMTIGFAVLFAWGCAPGESDLPAQVCSPNTTDCLGNAVVKCDPNGSAWVSLGQCATGASCSLGRCLQDQDFCGDGSCSADENCATCPADCGNCCGNGQCETLFTETELTCPADCARTPTCGDHVCDANIGENCSTCSADCGSCCGNGTCDHQYGETSVTCSADCQPAEFCGNGICSAAAGETFSNCAFDCSNVCGDGTCDHQYGETSVTCSADCPPITMDTCGNGTCETWETPDNCAADCQAPANCGDGNVDAANGEECDGANLNNTSCADLGFTSGSLGCSASCQFDTAACKNTVSWATTLGGTLSEAVYDMKVDAAGNSYLIGTFLGEASFGSTTLTSKGANDIYVVKLSTTGDVIWARSAGGTGTDAALGVAVDTTGNVYVTGYFKTQATFDTTTVTGSATIGNFFLAKYSSSGHLLWIVDEDATKWSGGKVLELDNAGNPIVAGILWETGTFGTTTLTSKGKGDPFVAKYSANGDFVWAMNFGGIDYDLVTDMVVNDKNEIFLAGQFKESIPTIKNWFGTSLSAIGKQDAFVVKIKSTGAVAWGEGLGSSEDDSATGIALDSVGDVVCIGTFGGTINFNSTTSFVPVGGKDSFMFRLSALLGLRSSISHITGSGSTAVSAIAIDNQNNAYVTGSYSGQMSRGSKVINAIGGEDAFVWKHDLTTKKTVWLSSAGGAQQDEGKSIAIDALGAIHVAGTFKGTATFDGNPKSSSGDKDLFVWSPVNP